MKKFIAAAAVIAALVLSSCSVWQDIWLPELTMVEPAPTPVYQKHIVPRENDPVFMAWEYRPQVYEGRDGLQVLSPMWLYLTEKDGEADLQDLSEMGYEDFDAKTQVKQAHEDQCEVWAVVVGFEPETTHKLVQSEDAVNTFAREIRKYVNFWGLDGINLDFEKMDPEDTDLFTDMVRVLRKTLPDVTLSVCVTVPVAGDSSESWYQSYDRAALAECCDYVAVMTYDGHKEGTIAPVAGQDWVRERLEMLLCDVPSNQILLGIPMHGVAYVTKPASDLSYEKRLSVSAEQTSELLQKGVLTVGDESYTVDAWLQQGARQEVWDVLEYEFTDTSGNTVTLLTEDETSLREKIALVDEYSLGGIAVWQKRGGRDSWWIAMKEAMEALNTTQNPE